jgi:L-ectoine synthase
MIVRSLAEIENGPRDVSGPTWRSRRLLLKGDGMGFSMHDTIIHAGTSTEMEYRNHLEAVYCVAGRGSVTVLGGETFPLAPGTIYALDRHDRHVLVAEETLRLVCVFNPPLSGRETHDASGSYPLTEREPESDTEPETETQTEEPAHD